MHRRSRNPEPHLFISLVTSHQRKEKHSTQILKLSAPGNSEKSSGNSNSGSDSVERSPGNEKCGLNFMETELTLGLPGGGRNNLELELAGKSQPVKREAEIAGNSAGKCFPAKRGFSETVDLNLSFSGKEEAEKKDSGPGNTRVAKVQIVGWPPVRSSFKKNNNSINNNNEIASYVKVAVDGAPYLRKVDLQTYSTYQQLLTALPNLFACFTICQSEYSSESKLVDISSGTEYVPTYEDKDGDWMLVGDVPWQ
ncbi:hypothetical protein AMTR_s00122p00021940 [Amborella trichopoda]|uniref:Auxin-responsive protein n=2 Tax=Amborella trichopoda TaxID=13333 RepID=W1NN64_AMBTC|nr:hypothetical protein AMTR_s00122p00021940 [Amborella trichopoda]